MRKRLLATAATTSILWATVAPVAASSGSAWWAPLAFTGRDVTSVAVSGGRLVASVDGTVMASTDGGATFVVADGSAAASSLPPGAPPQPGVSPRPAPTASSPPPVITAGGISWSIDAGHVLTGAEPSSLRPDPRAPFLGDTATFLAAPGALPGLVVAAGSDGHIWRRTPDGAWTTALVLLPAGGFSGAPQVTGLQAFTQPLSDAVYLATDGEGVLLSTDGAADWIRTDGAGLPDSVRALATSNRAHALYAATADGLWVHVLQAQPAPPVYTDAQLWLRWLGIAATALAAATAAIVALRLAAPARGRPGT